MLVDILFWVLLYFYLNIIVFFKNIVRGMIVVFESLYNIYGFFLFKIELDWLVFGESLILFLISFFEDLIGG